MSKPVKRLKRARHEKILAGVCGGFAHYFSVDPVLVRVLYIVLMLVTGFFPLAIAYLIMWIIMPEE